jgi:hypothetical protein
MSKKVYLFNNHYIYKRYYFFMASSIEIKMMVLLGLYVIANQFSHKWILWSIVSQ